jgi:hypothetical protein
VVRAEDSHPRGRGIESRCMLDGCKQFAIYYIEEKLKIKVAKWGTPKKILKKKKRIVNNTERKSKAKCEGKGKLH